MANSDLKGHFKNQHILGVHGASKKRNQVADFKNMKYKTVTKIEIISGKYSAKSKQSTSTNQNI